MSLSAIVVVIGEVLVKLKHAQPLADATQLRDILGHALDVLDLLVQEVALCVDPTSPQLSAALHHIYIYIYI